MSDLRGTLAVDSHADQGTALTVRAPDLDDANTGVQRTVVLGGVFQTEEIVSQSKTPVLGDIPYVGRLFRKDVTETSKNETLIFITPRILSEKLID